MRPFANAFTLLACVARSDWKIPLGALRFSLLPGVLLTASCSAATPTLGQSRQSVAAGDLSALHDGKYATADRGAPVWIGGQGTTLQLSSTGADFVLDWGVTDYSAYPIQRYYDPSSCTGLPSPGSDEDAPSCYGVSFGMNNELVYDWNAVAQCTLTLRRLDEKGILALHAGDTLLDVTPVQNLALSFVPQTQSTIAPIPSGFYRQYDPSFNPGSSHAVEVTPLSGGAAQISIMSRGTDGQFASREPGSTSYGELAHLVCVRVPGFAITSSIKPIPMGTRSFSAQGIRTCTPPTLPPNTLIPLFTCPLTTSRTKTPPWPSTSRSPPRPGSSCRSGRRTPPFAVCNVRCRRRPHLLRGLNRLPRAVAGVRRVGRHRSLSRVAARLEFQRG